MPASPTRSTSGFSVTSQTSKGISYVAALRLAEENEAALRATFDRFDLDKSGDIDMDELMVLLDDLNLLERLKTEPQEFTREMFVKYDTNFDGVLSFDEFTGLYNAALDDIMGRRTKDEAPRSPTKPSSTQEARKKLAAEKAAKKAAEAARIHKQNAEMKQRIMAMGKGKDPKALDAEIERQRRALAEARAAAKAAEKQQLAAENRELAARRKAVKAAVDDDITDDVAADGTVGAGRAEAAEASRARKAAEAAALAAENAEMRERIANTVARTDDDITDDVAADGTVGAGRAEAAAASKARKAAEAEQLAAENAEMRERIRNTGAATDNDITDDVAADGTVGAGRAEAAAASKARKAAEAATLEAENDAMRERIATTGAASVNQLS